MLERDDIKIISEINISFLKEYNETVCDIIEKYIGEVTDKIISPMNQRICELENINENLKHKIMALESKMRYMGD